MFIHAPNEPRSTKRLAATGRRVREHNAAMLLRLVWAARQGVSRADLARESGMSRSTVSAITADLLEAGLAVEDRVATPSGGGRPPILLQFPERRFLAIGIELGGAHLSVVRTDLRGQIEHHRSVDFPVPDDPEGAMALMVELVDEAIDRGEADRCPVGVGVGVSCPLDAHTPGRLSARIMPAWEGVDLGSLLYDRYRLPVLLDNDANLGALAEAWWGAGRGVQHFTYVKIATGVGAGHIVGGQIYRGASGIAGEIGHSMVVPKGGRRCRCGLSGCLEAEVGSTAILAKMRDRLTRPAASTLSGVEPLTLGAVVDAAKAGDPVATEVIRDAGQQLGVAMANLVNLMNPRRVILGGRLSTAGDLLLRPMRRAMSERALASNVEGAEVRVSDLHPGAIARGGATMVLDWALNNAHMLAPREPSPPLRASTRLLPTQPTLR